MKKIYLSPSNQTKNMYAYGNTNEAAQCRLIANACEVALKRNGFQVKTNYLGSLAEKVEQSNSWGADLHVPIHTNASNGKVTGTRMFYYSEKDNSKKACKAIYDVLAPLTPGKSENMRAFPDLYEIRGTKAPAVYIEAEFHDNPEAAKWIVEHVIEIGEAIAKGICNYYGVKYTASTITYKVQIGAFAKYENAEELLKKAKSAGFKSAFIAKA